MSLRVSVLPVFQIISKLNPPNAAFFISDEYKENPTSRMRKLNLKGGLT